MIAHNVHGEYFHKNLYICGWTSAVNTFRFEKLYKSRTEVLFKAKSALIPLPHQYFIQLDS